MKVKSKKIDLTLRTAYSAAFLLAASVGLLACEDNPSQPVVDMRKADALVDLKAPDLTPGEDLTQPAPDLTMPDLAQPDLAMPDLVMPDLTMPPDLTQPAADLTQPAPDLTEPAADLTVVPDLTPVADLTTPPDLAPAVPTAFYVVRVGDGTASLSSNATATFLEQRKLSDGSLIGAPIALPVAAAGNNQPLTLSGTATSEGQMTRSADGRYLVLAGYAATPGTASITSSTAVNVNRIVGRIDAAGNVDTSTRLTGAYDGSNVRSATSADGTSFWLAGNSSTTGGVQYVAFGVSAAGTQIVATPANTRVVQIFGGQLFVTSGSGGYTTINAVGALPATGPVTVTPLAGTPTTGASPYSYALFDRDGNVAGLDTLYVADDRTLASGGGIIKWTFDGTTWKQSTTVLTGGLTVGVRGLTAFVSGTNVVILATDTASPSNIVTVTDDGTAAPMAKVIATAATNTAYRGIALAPQ